MIKKLFFLILGLGFIQAGMAQDEARLLRFPAIYGDQVVFTYAGDLYTVEKAGGLARKLTNSDGFEMFAHFSPDGKTIAFTGQYDGNTEVFTIPSEGGAPVRLSHTATLGRDDVSDRMGPNNIVMAWRGDDKIVFRSRKKSFNSFVGQLFEIDKNGGMSEQLPVPEGGWCSFSADQQKMAYNRIFRTFRTWKYYKGGMAPDVWIYDYNTKQSENITNNDAQDIFPMWHGDKIYFISDRDRIMNLFVYDINSKETRKLTNFEDYDIKFPNLGDKEIIFEKGGYLYTFDLATEQINKIEVRIVNDLLSSREKIVDASKYINSYSISPSGKRIAFGARGEVFTVPAKEGITRNLTHNPKAHDRNVGWSPDGKWIAFISDATGEDEIYIIQQDGKGAPIQLTKDKDTYKYDLDWSPDSKKILWSDNMRRLRYVDIDSKKTTEVAQTSDGELRDFNWAFDSKWIAFTWPQYNSVSRIKIYSLESKESRFVTDNWYDASSPSFSSDGKYLFFTSSRDFNPIYSWTEWNHAYQDMLSIYFITLQKDTESPFAPKNDEVAVKDEKEEAKEADKKEDKKEENDEDKGLQIDFDGIIDRVLELPLRAGIYYNVNAVGDDVYYNEFSRGSGQTKLMVYNLKSEKENEIGAFRGYMITPDNKKMMVMKGRKYGIISLPKGKTTVKDWLNLSNMKVKVNPKDEWQQIYTESWRQMRDFFYDPGMHGNDWNAVYEKYNVLIPYVQERNDLNYVIGEMIGELNVGHAYVNGGDKNSPDRIKTGLLGAEIVKDKDGYFKIEKILKGENWISNSRSPLTEVGVDVSEGDYITSINGKDLKDVEDIYSELIGQAGKPVVFTFSHEANGKDSFEEIIEPIADESQLYYYNWVQDNIRKVNEATDGKVGYIHIPDMGPAGLNEFVKHYYPQLNKKALIIDDRGNGGGNVSPMIIERLRRELAMYGHGRNATTDTKPRGMMVGPKVLLVNQYSASDGDLFPYQFRKYNLGKIIGRRSWGGVVGIRGSLPFVDGGELRKPEFGPFDVEGKKWIIEGYGVDPDIFVDNDPAKEFAGEDQQLNKAIEVILEELKSYPEQYPELPEYPDKTK